MTENEAKMKWCPFVRFTPPSEKSDWENNRPGGHMNGAYCIASQCMAWHFKTVAKDSGYCGLAGKP
jgi:hypothetical protein